MAKFMLAYHGGGMPETPEEGERVMAAWTSWLDELGAACIDPGNPVGKSKTVHADRIADDGGIDPLSGYSIIEADTIEAACEMARGCPILDGGKGTVEVAQIHEM